MPRHRPAHRTLAASLATSLLALPVLLGLAAPAHAQNHGARRPAPQMKLLPLPAGPTDFVIDPRHTHPTFFADHFGISDWSGKFDTVTGTLSTDAARGTGSVDITVHTASINFGLPALNQRTQAADFFDVARYPIATYRGTLTGFEHGKPTEVRGTLTIRGISRPVTLKITHFGCIPNFGGGIRCGANATATINRADFGVRWGIGAPLNLSPITHLVIQVEGVHRGAAAASGHDQGGGRAGE